MTMATAVGIATGVGSMVAKVGHDYVLPHIPHISIFVFVFVVYTGDEH